MAISRKTRVIPYEGLKGSMLRVVDRNFNTGSRTVSETKVSAAQSPLSYLHGRQITDSESHPEWIRRKNGKFAGDIGGPFTTTKWYAKDFVSSSGKTYGEVYYNPTIIFPGGSQHQSVSFSGPIMPTAPTAGFMPFPPNSASSESVLTQLGTAAIARCGPSNPTASLATTIGELFKDGIPSIVGGTLKQWAGMSNRERRKAIGGEYLNVEFGWKPLIADITDVALAIVGADQIMTDYERDSGKMVRRGYDFPETLDTKSRIVRTDCSPSTDISAGGMYNPLLTNKGTVIRTETTRRRQWFRGAFTYYVPPPGGIRNEIARHVIFARKWLGLSLTPDTVWNLMPWSWGVDWFGSTGDVIANWSSWAIDNQVVVYGYLMEHSSTEWNYTFTGPNPMKGGGSPASVTLVRETKLRRQSSPYGFGFTNGMLSSRQKLIIAALGLTKS